MFLIKETLVNITKSKSTYILILVIIFIILFAIRLPYIGNPPFERYEMWRQSDTESMARNFIEGNYNIFYPQLNYDGPAPNYVQLEFQVTTFIIAILYTLFGFHYEFARLVPTFFFMGSCVYLFLIATNYYGRRAAVFATLLYGMYPLTLYFSRAIMPEPAGMLFFMGAFYHFDLWIRKEKNVHLALAALFTSLAVATKIPAIFVGVPMLAMAIVKYRQTIFKTWPLYFFAIFSLVPPYLYFKWLEGISTKAFVSGIAKLHIFPKAGTAFFTDEAVAFYMTKMPESLTWIGIVLFIVGLFFINWRKEYPIGIWAIAMIIEVIVIVSVIRFNYYLVFIVPVMALLSGKVLAMVSKTKVGLIIASTFIIAFGTWNYYNVLPRFELNDNILGQAKVVKELTNKEDLILVGTLGPELINASDRKGWRFHLPNDKGDLEAAGIRLSEYIDQGAMYFIPAGKYIHGDLDGQFRHYLEATFERIEAGEFSIYKLQ